jgi:hypothetical protein
LYFEGSITGHEFQRPRPVQRKHAFECTPAHWAIGLVFTRPLEQAVLAHNVLTRHETYDRVSGTILTGVVT